ncbi:hypothetical protein H5410_030452 [Solanum commersonii]|uniref:Uncharacterized protein n=1 Tax=Solanum commersonii TaxID=4109 RepID=A0A9J5YFQ2_SOLCO|nr:hypothetical protein H5410_030452 [Solanum commersonii]
MSMSLIGLSIIQKSFNLIRTTREQVDIQLIVQEREENEASKRRQDTFVSVEDRSTRKKDMRRKNDELKNEKDKVQGRAKLYLEKLKELESRVSLKEEETAKNGIVDV